jgi:integrase
MKPKPAKPTPDFPLFAHNSGQWAKKIAGRNVYFGKWSEPDAALARYQQLCVQKGTDKVSVPTTETTVSDACNRFLMAKDEQHRSGALSTITFQEYLRTCKRVVDFFGRDTAVSSLGPNQFADWKSTRSKTMNIVGVGNEITRVRGIFRWCKDQEVIEHVPNFGPDFRKASAKALRRHKRFAGQKLFTPEQIRLLLDEAGVHLHAMILLGINCAFGPADCATMPVGAVDFKRGWLSYPRPKTEVDRLISLWPETLEALKRSSARRYSDTGRFFVMRDGKDWDNSNHPICKHFRQAAERAGLACGGFYWLRHTFETIGGGAKDQVAVNSCMGHVDGSMAAVYREHIDEERLIAVTDHVRRWLFE